MLYHAVPQVAESAIAESEGGSRVKRDMPPAWSESDSRSMKWP